MTQKFAFGMFALLVAAVMTAVLPWPAAAGEGFFPDGHAPTEEEVRVWAQRVKDFRETLRPGESGRFSAVRIDATSVFLLDTREGHLWVWTFGEKGSFTSYQGQLLPGLAMGDIVGASAGHEKGGKADAKRRE